LLTDRQTNKVWQKHYLLGVGNKFVVVNVNGMFFGTIKVDTSV